MYQKCLLTAIVICVLSGSAFTAVPQLFNYQGFLTAGGGNPLTGTFSMTFTIYDDSTGGNIIWTETQPGIVVDVGNFSALLGSVTTLVYTVFNGTTRYLGVKVGTDPEITPRTRLATSPYAFRISTVDGASGGTITGNISIGSTPNSNIKVLINPSFNIPVTQFGLLSNLTNSFSGELYGVRGTVHHSTAGLGANAYGVYGYARSDGESRFGLYGMAQAENFSINTGFSFGVYATAFDGETAYGIYASAASATVNYAGYFAGNVNVTGTLSKGGGSFRIDHPLDPENKYLQHSFVESPDMMNVYNGNVVTDANGYATVTLPEYFEILNKDFRYQLTVIGEFAQAIVAEKVTGNWFTIRTDIPNMEVSWQVTGIRKDKWAEANRIQVELDKPDNEKGLYLHHEEYNMPIEKSVNRVQLLEEKKLREERSLDRN